jgi:hypothetical protein
LSPEIVLNEAFADNNVAEKDIFALLLPEGCGAANADHQSKLDTLKAGTKASCCGRSSNLSHVRHMHQNDIMVSDHADGVSI